MNENFDNRQASKTYRWLGPLCGLAALILYIFTLSPGAYPGISAKLIADYTGLSPFMPLLHPLWWLCAQIVKAIPIGSVVIRLNIFSALCGALNVWLMYEIVVRIRHNRTSEERRASVSPDWTQRASALVAAGFLATAIPFWIISTRAHTVSLGILIVLFLLRQLQKYHDDGRLFRFYIITFGAGVGVMEFPTMILLALPFLIALFYQMFAKEVFVKRHKKMKRSPFWGWLIKAVFMVAVGALPALIVAWIFKSTPAYEWRDFPHFFSLLVHIARIYFRELGTSTSQLGWLLVSFVSFIPCAAVLIVKREHGRDKIIGSYFFHLVLALLAVVLIFNIYVSPWALYGMSMLVVTPYLFMAVWIGYVAGYWIALFRQRGWGHNQGRISKGLQNIVKRILPALYPALIIAAIVLNFSICNGRNAAPVQRLARDIVANMQEHEWLISNGIMDDMVKIAADRQGADFNIINPRLGASKPYLRYLSTKFDSTRLKGLAMLGLTPLIEEWFSDHSEYVAKNVAVLANPDIWLASDFQIVPNGTVYFGAPPEEPALREVEPDKFARQWEEYIYNDNESEGWAEMVAPWNELAVRHVSKVVNNLGFAVQEADRPRQALQAYKMAYEIEPDNVSAVLNIVSLADNLENVDSEKWHDRLDEKIEEIGRELNSWNLSYLYGYVFQPMTYVNRGLVWAMSGKPNLGIAEIRRAIALGGQGEHLKVLLAGMYFMQQHGEKSEEIYLEILKENPESVDAIRGLVRINVSRGNFDMARGYIKRLEEIGVEESKIRMEEAILESVAGDKAKAKDILKQLLQKDSDNLKAWTMLALIAVEQNDRELQDKCLKQFHKEGVPIPRELLMAMTQVALTQRDTVIARKYIDQLLERYPREEGFLEWRLRIDVYEYNRVETEKSVERLMAVNPKNGFANFILGTLHIYREQYALAEPPLRVSVEDKREVKRLNTLAYTLYIRNKNEEAMEYAKEALEVDDRHGPAWDTYAMLLYRQGEYDAAFAAIMRAIDFMPDNPEIKYHLAQIYDKKGEPRKAMDILDEILQRPSQFALSLYDEIRRTANQVRQKIQ